MERDLENSLIIDKIISGARWATLLRIIAQVISWICTIVVVRFISSGDYGLNAMLQTPMEFFLLLSTFGLDAALVRAKTLEPQELRSAFGALLLINGIFFLAYFFGSPFIAVYFNEPRLDILAKTLAFMFLLIPFRVIPNALLNRELKFKLKASAELATSIIAALAVLTMAIYGAGVWALIIGVLIGQILLAAILMFVEPWFLVPSLNFQKVRGMISFGGTMILSTAVYMITNMFPVLIAGPTIGPDLLGIFVVSLQFAMLPLVKIISIINPIVFPAFSKFQGQPTAIGYYLEKALGISALVLLPLMIGLACVAQEFVQTLLGEKWIPAVVPLTLLSLFMPFRGVTYFIRQVSEGIGYPGISLKSSLITCVLTFSFIMIGKNHGLMGVVMAIILSEPIATIATIQLSKQAIDTSILRIARSLRPALTGSAVMAIAVFGMNIFLAGAPEIVRLTAAIGAGGIVYLAVIRIFFPSQITNAIKLLSR